MHFTYNNHLKYFIGGREFGTRENSFEKFNVNLGSIDIDHYRNNNLSSELRRISDLVYQQLGKDIVLFLSGGTDSEIVARNFISIGFKPKCITIRLPGYNEYDVNLAINIAKELDLDCTIVDIDIKDYFYSGKAQDLGDNIQCSQITYLMVYEQIKKMSSPAVMGGEVLLRRNIQVDPSCWNYVFRENEDASAMRFSLKYNIPLVNEWFSYTPEAMLYYLEDPSIISLVSEKYNYKLSSFSIKNDILKRLLPDIGLTVRKKTHGFEKLLGFNLEALRRIPEKQIQRLEASLDGINFETTLQMLRGTYGNN
jgi:hypothetical protein